MSNIITIAQDFSKTPGTRFRKDGSWSGEQFREDYLIPAIERGPLTIILDGAEGYPFCFREEAFGGLIRRGLPYSMIEKRLEIVAQTQPYERYIPMIWSAIRAAANNE